MEPERYSASDELVERQREELRKSRKLQRRRHHQRHHHPQTQHHLDLDGASQPSPLLPPPAQKDSPSRRGVAPTTLVRSWASEVDALSSSVDATSFQQHEQQQQQQQQQQQHKQGAGGSGAGPDTALVVGDPDHGPAALQLETQVEGLSQAAIKNCAARQRLFAAKIQAFSAAGDYLRAQEYSCALEAEIQKSISLELLHNSLTTAIEEQDFPTAMELQAELKTLLGQDESMTLSGTTASGERGGEAVSGRPELAGEAEASGLAAGHGGGARAAKANTLLARSPAGYTPHSPRTAQDILVNQLDSRDIAMGLQQEKEACTQCKRQQAALDELQSDRRTASAARKQRWRKLRTLRIQLQDELSVVRQLKNALRVNAARLAPDQLQRARPVVRTARRLEKQCRRFEGAVSSLSKGLHSASSNASNYFDLRDSMNQSSSSQAAAAAADVVVDGHNQQLHDDSGTLSVSTVGTGSLSVMMNLSRIQPAAESFFEPLLSNSHGGDDLSAAALKTATSAGGVALRAANSIRRKILECRSVQDELRRNMKLSTFEERFAEAHQLWTQLGVEECTETQLLSFLDSYDEAVRGCRFREAASLQARVARLQSKEAKAAEFWRLAACRSCRVRAAEALAARRYLCDDAEISRTLRFKIARLSQFIATAKSLATELAELQPTDLGPESVEYALDSDFAAPEEKATAEGRRRGGRGGGSSDLDDNNQSTNGSEGSEGGGSTAIQSARSARGSGSENYPSLHGGDEVAEAREARIRVQNRHKLEQLVGSNAGGAKSSTSQAAAAAAAGGGGGGGSIDDLPQFGSNEQRVVCEGPLIQVRTDSGQPQRRHFRLFYAAPPRFRGPFLCCHEVAFSPFHDYDQHNQLLASSGSKLPDGQKGDGRLLASFDLMSSDCLELAGSTTFSDGGDDDDDDDDDDDAGGAHATSGQAAAVKAALAEAAAARGSVGDGVWYGFVIRAGHEIKLLAFADSEAERLRWIRAIDACLESFADAEQRLQRQQAAKSNGGGAAATAPPPPLPDPQLKMDSDLQEDSIRRQQLMEEAEVNRVMEDVRRRQEQRKNSKRALPPAEAGEASRPTNGKVVATGGGSVVVAPHADDVNDRRRVLSVTAAAATTTTGGVRNHGSPRDTGNPTVVERAARTPIPRRPVGGGGFRGTGGMRDKDYYCYDDDNNNNNNNNNSSETSRSDSGSENAPSANRRLNRRFSVGGSLIAGASATPPGQRGFRASKSMPSAGGADGRRTSRSVDEEKGLRALLGIPESYLVDVFLQPGSLGCVMEEQDAPSGVPVVVIDTLRPHVQAGLQVGDIVCFINGTSCVGRDMDHIADLVGADLSASKQQRSMTILRRAARPPLGSERKRPPTPGGLSDDSTTEEDDNTDAVSEVDDVASLGGHYTPRKGADGLSLIQRRKLDREIRRAEKAQARKEAHEKLLQQQQQQQQQQQSHQTAVDRQPFKHLVLQVGPRESLGLSLMEVDDELLEQTAPALRPSGRLLVDEVVPGSPAERAGLHYGDVLVMMNGRPVRNLSLDDAVDAIAGTLADQHKTLVFERGLVDPATVTTASPVKEAPPPRQAAPAADPNLPVVVVPVEMGVRQVQPFDRHNDAEIQDAAVEAVVPQSSSSSWHDEDRSSHATNHGGMTQRERAAAQLRLKPPVSSYRGHHPSQDAVADYRSAASRRTVVPSPEDGSRNADNFGVRRAGNNYSGRNDQQPQPQPQPQPQQQRRRQQPQPQQQQQPTAEGHEFSMATHPVPATGNTSVRRFAKSQEEADVELVHQQIGALLAKQNALRASKSSRSVDAAAVAGGPEGSSRQRDDGGFEDDAARVHRTAAHQTQAQPWGSRTGDYGNTYGPYDDDDDDGETVDTVERELDAIEELVRNKHVLR